MENVVVAGEEEEEEEEEAEVEDEAVDELELPVNGID